MHIFFLLLALLIPSPTYADSGSQTADIKLSITGFKNDSGFVMISLSGNEEAYKNSSGNKFYGIKARIVNGEVEALYKDIPYGRYAIKLFHDENSDGELNRNLLGIPTEDYGFSNNAAASFGQPSFEDASFEVADPIMMSILKVE